MKQKIKDIFNSWIDTALIFLMESRYDKRYKEDRDFYNKVKSSRKVVL